MSDPFLNLLEEAWNKILSTIERDPDELARRVARRDLGLMRRRPRAWCLAVRAADSRIPQELIPRDASSDDSNLNLARCDDTPGSDAGDATSIKEPNAEPGVNHAGLNEKGYPEHQVTLDA